MTIIFVRITYKQKYLMIVFWGNYKFLLNLYEVLIVVVMFLLQLCAKTICYKYLLQLFATNICYKYLLQIFDFYEVIKNDKIQWHLINVKIVWQFKKWFFVNLVSTSKDKYY